MSSVLVGRVAVAMRVLDERFVAARAAEVVSSTVVLFCCRRVLGADLHAADGIPDCVGHRGDLLIGGWIQSGEPADCRRPDAGVMGAWSPETDGAAHPQEAAGFKRGACHGPSVPAYGIIVAPLRPCRKSRRPDGSFEECSPPGMRDNWDQAERSLSAAVVQLRSRSSYVPLSRDSCSIARLENEPINGAGRSLLPPATGHSPRS